MTPFDTALRIRRREVDRIRVDIAVTVSHVEEIAARDAAIQARLVEEHRAAAAFRLPADAWAARMRAERARLDDARRFADARLADLRAKAADAYGEMRALEEAAHRHQAEAERTAASAEQARLDDIAASRFLREQRRCH